jgi:hypothetical protein
MDIKTSFYDLMSDVQKDWENASARIGIFEEIRYIYEFCPEFDVKGGKVNFDLAWLKSGRYRHSIWFKSYPNILKVQDISALHKVQEYIT